MSVTTRSRKAKNILGKKGPGFLEGGDRESLEKIDQGETVADLFGALNVKSGIDKGGE